MRVKFYEFFGNILKKFLIISILVLISGFYLNDSFGDVYYRNIDISLEKAERIQTNNFDIIILEVVFTNNDDESEYLSDGRIQLETNRSYYSNVDYFEYKKQNIQGLEDKCPIYNISDLNPKVPVTKFLCFSVPTNSKIFTLNIYESSPDYCRNPSYGSCSENSLRIGEIKVTKQETSSSSSSNSSSSSSTSTTLTGAIPENVDVVINSGSSSPDCYDNKSCTTPNTITVGKGSKIIFYNNDSVSMQIVSGNPERGPSDIFDSGIISSKKSKMITVSDEDTIKYFCKNHPWIQGTVVVKRGAPVISHFELNPTSNTPKDITPPKMLPPNDIVIEADNNVGLKVNFEVLSIDDKDKNIYPSCNPASGKFFPIGKTTVKCNAQDSSGNWAEPISFTVTVNAPSSEVPDWVKNNAKWWSEGLVDDSTFSQGIGFLIKEKVISVSSLPPQASSVAEEKIPGWIKNNAKWWADGMISEDDFLKGITYMVEKGIIRAQ